MNFIKPGRNPGDHLTSVTNPRWDGTRVLFQIDIGGRSIPCAISRAALQEITSCHYIASGDLLRRFADGRGRIEKIAADIFAARPDSVSGTLNIWADDIYDPPSAPAVALALEAPART